MNEKLKTSFTMTQTAKDLLEALSEVYGLNQSAMLEVIIRDRAKQEGIEWRDKQPKK